MTPRQTILVVEDNPITRKMVRVTLEQAGYGVQEAPDGHTALAHFRTHAPDLIIQDLVLPDIDGVDLGRQLRATPEGASIPIVVFSGFLSRIEQARTGTVGFTDYLFKPVEPSRILQAVQAHLATGTAAAGMPGNGRRVLVADDDAVTRKLLKIRLEHLGFDVDTAADGAQALARARRVRPTAIVSDVLMPRLDGFRLCAALRNDRRLAHIPIVLTSCSYQEKGDERLARSAGASALVLRTPDCNAVIDALLKACAEKRRPTRARRAAEPKDDYIHRVIRQLERQVAQNTELTQRLAQREAELSLIAGLQTLDTTSDVNAVAHEVLVRALDAAAASKGAVYLVDQDGRLSLGASLGYPGLEAAEVQGFFGFADVLASSLERGEIVCVPSSRLAMDRAAPLLERSKSGGLVIAPIIKGDDRLGILVAGTSDQSVSDEWVEFVRSIASQIAEALVVTRAFARVAAAEQQFRAIFDNNLYGLFRSTPAGRFLAVNPALVRIYGDRSAADMISAIDDLGTQVYVDPARRAEFLRLLSERGVVSRFEASIRRKDESIAWISISAQAVRDPAGAVRYIEGAVEDVTERRKAEATATALAEVSRTLSRSIDPDTVGRLVTENVCRLLDARSAAVYRLEAGSSVLLLVTASELVPGGFHWLPRLAGPDAGMAGLAVQEQRPVASPDVLDDPRGTYTAERRSVLESDGDRALLAIPLLARDRTFGALVVSAPTGRMFTDEEIALAQAFADQAGLALDNAHLVADLRGSRDFLASIAQNSADAIMTTDIDGRITYFSPGAERIFGYRVDEIIGRSGGELYVSGPDEASALRQRSLVEGQISEYETRFRTKDGRVLDVSASISLLRDASGAITGRVSVIRDMTERKRMEATLRQSEKLAAMGSLLAGVAHELNNPLAVVGGHARLLKTHATDARLVKRAEKIADAADRCARIIKNFLALARQAPPERASTDLNGVVREAVELIAYPLRVDGIEVTLDLAPDLPQLWADSHQLHQLIVNLVTNAHHALRERELPRKLTLSSVFDAGDGAVRLEVADNGPGIPAEVQQRIFEPFFTTKPVGKGTGLGLSLCQSIVVDHGGTMEVVSAPGRGAVFSMRLPVMSPDVTTGEATPAEAAPPPPCTILVVDDESEVAALLAEILGDGGHRVETVADGIAALEKLAERPYDAILSDLRMPELDGPSLYREVERRYPQLVSRFAFLTGDALGDETRAFLEAVRAPQLGKPFSAEEVVRVLRQVLARSGQLA